MPARSNEEFLDIIRRALAGCNDSVQILMDEYREPLLMVIRKKLPRQAPLRRIFDSTDFLQETFLEAFAGKLADKDFQPPQAFVRYLQVIAENRLRDTVRKNLLSQRASFSHEVSLNAGLKTGEPRTEDQALAGLEREEERALLAKRLACLPLVHRTVLRYWLDGFKPAEIAEKLKLSVVLTYQCLDSARRSVRLDLRAGGGRATA